MYINSKVETVRMKIVFHPEYLKVYSNDPAASPGRLECIIEELKGYEFVEPSPASLDDIRLVHTDEYVEEVKREGVYDIAALAVGGAVKASEIAFKEPAFALIRPPGHHASPDRGWGFCYFNNVAISVRRLIKRGVIRKAVIVDFDLHFGDGTANTFCTDKNVMYFHMPQDDIGSLEDFLRSTEYEIIAVSAGFDKHKMDWGYYLETGDFKTIGMIIKEYAEERCNGRRYAVLEGGYNKSVLGKNVKAFIKGFE